MSHPENPPVIAIVGATGAVGRELVGGLERRGTPLSALRLLASARSAGQVIAFRGAQLPVEELTESSFDGVELALFLAGPTCRAAMHRWRGPRAHWLSTIPRPSAWIPGCR